MPGRLLTLQEANEARDRRTIRRAAARTSTIPVTMSFQLSPYDAALDLSKNDDRKLYLEAIKGLKEATHFTGKKTDFDQFSKLMGKAFKDVRVMEILTIPTEWDATNADAALQRIPTDAGLLNLFDDNKVTKEQVGAKSELVWSSSDMTSTSKYFAKFDANPTDDATLNAARNRAKMKHVIMGKKIWSSLTAEFQIEIMGKEDEFTVGKSDDYDGPMLWDFIRRRVKPSTKVGASKLKEEIESKKLTAFNNDVAKYNTWFEDTRRAIIAEEGEGYNEYTRMLFKAYKSSTNVEFKESVKEEERKWIQDKLKADYSFVDLLELGRVTFNNQVENGNWETQKQSTQSKVAEQPQFLALATEILNKLKGGGDASKTDASKYNGQEKRTYQPWRYENPDGKATKEVRGATMKWCTKDCHDAPMWCGRKNCLGRQEFADAMRKRKEDKQGGANSEKKNNFADDFKIALAAMTSAEDYQTLTEQFMGSKE